MADKRYKFYLFDLDRTLWDFDKNAKSALFKLVDDLKLGELFGVTDKEEFFCRYEFINHSLWAQYEKGEITKEELRYQRFLRTLKGYMEQAERGSLPSHNFTPDNLREFAISFGETYLDYMAYEMELVKGAKEVLDWVKGIGGKIALISNGFKEVQYRKLRNSNILHYMDAVVISEEVGIMKPSPLIFKKALIALCGEDFYNNNPSGAREMAIMVGDDFTNDIEGAQIFGIEQFYYNPHHKPCDGAPTYESDNLLDLIN